MSTVETNPEENAPKNEGGQDAADAPVTTDDTPPADTLPSPHPNRTKVH